MTRRKQITQLNQIWFKTNS